MKNTDVERRPETGERPVELPDQAYHEVLEDEKQRLDLYLPAGGSPFPVAVWIHGGGWHSCGRGVRNVAPIFTKRGFALASIGYRSIKDDHSFPAQLCDCLAGMNWLATHADRHGLDLSKAAVFGHSAGAHLSSLVLLAAAGRLPGRAGLSPEVKIVAGAFWSGVFDLSRKRGNWPADSFVGKDDSVFSTMFFRGGRYNEDAAVEASPASFADGDPLPPMLIVHGDQDSLVPIGQAAAFSRLASLSGAKIDFRIEEGAGHGMPESIWGDSLDFFERVLNFKAGAPRSNLL